LQGDFGRDWWLSLKVKNQNKNTLKDSKRFFITAQGVAWKYQNERI
jgi:hypothetical protein